MDGRYSSNLPVSPANAPGVGERSEHSSKAKKQLLVSLRKFSTTDYQLIGTCS